MKVRGLKRIRYFCSFDYKLCWFGIGRCWIWLILLVLYEKLKFLGFGGSMVVRLKFKGIDGRVLLGVEFVV